MSVYDSTHVESTDLEPRDVRALTEVMSVLDDHDPRVRGADDMYLVVSSSGAEYVVDVRTASCTCPDFEYNLPTENGRQTCKHIARVTYETGMRPIPGWIDREALDDQLGAHIDATPTVARSAVATDGGHERPVDCECRSDAELECWHCFRARDDQQDHTAL